jgi:hypothetical protein
MPPTVPTILEEAVANLLERRPLSWKLVRGGYTPAVRWLIDLGSDTAFVKLATTAGTARMIRREQQIYGIIHAPFMPAFLGMGEIDNMPFILLEDLSHGRWPPPWDEPLVAAVLASIRAVHDFPCQDAVFAAAPPIASGGWQQVAADPYPFLNLKLVSREWLDFCLPQLIPAERACRTDGEALTHFDLRSDNLCSANGTVKLIDWAEARLANPELDIGFWLPSLHYEGGPPPEAILGDQPEIAAWVSGFFAARSGQPELCGAPRVRLVQREQLSTALPWVVRALRLPQPDTLP